MLFCSGFENGAAKQQLQKWELKFVTELEPLEFFFPSCASVALARSSHIVVLSERITQVHTLYPSLGVRKWSKDHSVRSLVSPHKEADNENNKTSKPHKTQTNNHKSAKKELTRRLQSTAASSACELKDLAHETKKKTRPQRKILRRCPAKHITQQRRNPGSPLPGSRRSH